MDRVSSRLAGRTVALLEARRSDELAALIEKQGGTALSAPALREDAVADPAAITAFLDRLRADPPRFVILQTGVGTARLLAAVQTLGREAEWRDALERATVVSRGPKPAAALRQAGLAPDLAVPAPYTTAEVLNTLGSRDIRAQHVAIQQHGERNVELMEALETQGARLSDVTLYRWALPADTGPLRRLLRRLSAGDVDAIAFTSQAQVRHLCLVAAEEGLAEALPALLQRHTLVAAVGPVTAQALAAHGLAADIIADPPKAGAMVGAIVSRLGTASGTRRLTRPAMLGIHDELDRTSLEYTPATGRR